MHPRTDRHKSRRPDNAAMRERLKTRANERRLITARPLPR